MDQAATTLGAIKQRRASRNRSRLQPYDRRTKIGRRTRKLVELFRARIGPPQSEDPLLLVQVERAARLMALNEVVSARVLRGDPTVTLDDLVRLQNCADLAMRRLPFRHQPNAEEETLFDALRAHPP